MQEGDKPGQVIDPNTASSNAEAPASASWQFVNDDQSTAQAEVPKVDEAIQWTASEFIAHEKGMTWYAGVVLATAVVAGVTYLIAKDIFTPVIILIVGLLFGVMGARKPRELQYVIDERGVYIGEKFYAYSNFKSFSIVQEGAVESIWFMPLKRFMPGLNIYFAPNDGPHIIESLSQFLPVEGRQLDPIDRLMHKIGF